MKPAKTRDIVRVVLNESRSISRKAVGVLVVTHRLGFTSANAGIDQSNVEHGDERVLLPPARSRCFCRGNP